jgi:hypothetical protein
MENAKFSPPMEQTSRMSPLTRYAFSLFICIYGIYQLMHDHAVPGVIAVLLAAFIFWISRRR